MEVKINRTFIELVKGDITELATDAIVNAANTALQLGGRAGIEVTNQNKREIDRIIHSIVKPLKVLCCIVRFDCYNCVFRMPAQI